MGLFNEDTFYHRNLLIEKRIVPSYINENGIEVWVDRYGNTYYPNTLGFYDKEFFESGYIYAPYIPMYVSPGVHTREFDTSTIIGISSRGYSAAPVNPELYRPISFDAVSTAHTFTYITDVEM